MRHLGKGEKGLMSSQRMALNTKILNNIEKVGFLYLE